MFPAELIDHILSFLHDDISALKACSNAHPFLSRLAERHLYTRIVVKPFSDPPAVSDLHEQFSKNSRILEYPRILEFLSGFYSTVDLPILPIISIIPQMSNLTSLEFYGIPCPFNLYDDFISTLKTCLQQSSIEKLILLYLYDFPFSILDHSRNIKQLTLSECTAMEEPISSTGASQQPLDTLVLSGDLDLDLLHWASSKVTNLTSLELLDLPLDFEWPVPGFPDLLRACSNSLTSFRLGIEHNWRCAYKYDADIHVADQWINNLPEIPFTLSPLTHLKKLSVFALVDLGVTEIVCALPAIIQLIHSAPAIDSVALFFHCHVSADIAFLGRFNWAILGRLHSDLAHIHPHIDLCITAEGIVGPSFSPESILDALAGNKDLMDLVKRGLVDLK